MKENKTKAKLAIGVVIATGLAILPASAIGGTSKSYVLKHAKEHCKANYVKRTEKVKKLEHGKKVKIKETVCVYVAPKAPVSPAAKPAPTITTPGPTQTVTTLSIKRAPKKLLGVELGKGGCWNLASVKEDLSLVLELGGTGKTGLEGKALEEELEALKKEEVELEKELKGITADLCFYEAEAQVKTPGGTPIAGSTTLDFTNGLEAGRQWILPGGSKLPLVEFTVSIDEHTLTALVSVELGSLVTEFLEKLNITELEKELTEESEKLSKGGSLEGGLATEVGGFVKAIPAIPIVGMSDGTGPFTGSGGWTVSAKYAGSTEFSASESSPTPID